MSISTSPAFTTDLGRLHHGDVLEVLATCDEPAQLILADPPYFQVLEDQAWDTSWPNAEAYLDWTSQWVAACQRLLAPDGLFYIFGQLGKREHVWLHTCSLLTKSMQFHDMIIWDRAVGYNERSDSFTPQYEMILVLRHSGDTPPYFNKDAVRLPYDEATIQTYLRDPRYKDKAAREKHLRKGKYATNILRIPSLKGNSTEKVGHPSQKPLKLIENLIRSGSRPGDLVLDPFMGSGTTALASEKLQRRWLGTEAQADYVRMIEKRLQAHRNSQSGDLFESQ